MVSTRFFKQFSNYLRHGLGAFALLFTLLLTQTLHAATPICGFDYNDKRYEWLKASNYYDQFFYAINDSGQAITYKTYGDTGREFKVEFFDTHTYSGRQVTAGYQYDGEYDSWVRPIFYGISNEGEVFGSVYLATEIPAGAPPEAQDFKIYSIGFSYFWNPESGLVDMDKIIGGISGRSDVGYESSIVPNQELVNGEIVSTGGFHLLTTHYLQTGGRDEWETQLPWTIRDKEHHITAAMLDSIENQCGQSPVSDPETWLQDKQYDSNKNLEFVTYVYLVRLARPVLGIFTEHWWYSTDAEGNPVYTYDDEGTLKETLGLRFDIDNNGLVDVNGLRATVEIVEGGGSDPVASVYYQESTPSYLAQKTGTDYLYAYFDLHKAGQFSYRVKVDGTGANGDAFTLYSRTSTLTVIGSGTQLRIVPEDEPLEIDDESSIDLIVSSDESVAQSIQYSDPVLSVDDASIIKFTSPPVPDPFELSSSTGPRTTYIPFTALKAGVATVTSTITATDTQTQEQEVIKEQKSIVVSPLEINVTAIPEQFLVNETLPEDLSPRCREYNVQHADAPVANCVEIQVKVKNISEQTVEHLVAIDAADITDAIKSLDPDHISVPLEQFHFAPPVGAPAESPYEIALAHNDVVTYTWLVEAQGGAPLLEIRPVFRGSIGTANIQDSATDTLKLVENPLLKFGAKLKRPFNNLGHPDYSSANQPFAGSPIRLEGFLENHSTTHWIGATVFAIPSENAGRGILFDAASDYRPDVDTSDRSCTKFAETEAVFLPDMNEGFLLAPKQPGGDPTRLDLEGVLATLCWDEFSEAKVSYYVKAYTLETDGDGNLVKDENGNPVRVDDLARQIVYEDEDDYGDEFTIPLKANPYVPLEAEESECQYVMTGFHLVCYGAAGVQSLLYGLVDIPPFMFHVLKQDAYYGVRLAHWSAEQFGTMYDAFLEDDPDAYAKLKAEAKLVSDSLVRAAVITADQQEALVVKAVDKLGGVAEDYKNGDYKKLSGQMAYVVGENIDSFVTVGMVKSMASKMQRARQIINSSEQAAELTKAVNNSLKKIAEKADVTAVTDRVKYYAANNPGTNILKSGVLKANDALSYGLIEKYGGVSRDTVQLIEDIATKYKVNLAFRSRGAAAIDKIKNGLAYWKPMSIKLKNVNDIDIKYLGYPPAAKDTVIFVEPPIKVPDSINFSAKNWENDIAMTNALDDWMKQKGFEKPNGLYNLDNELNFNRNIEIGDFNIDQKMDKYLQVRERLRQRTVEWTKYRESKYFGTPENPGDFVKNGLPLEFGYEANGLPAILDKVPYLKGERRAFRVQEGAWVNDAEGVAHFVEKTEDGRKIFAIEVNGPHGYRPFTGDIDFLHILDETGALITNPIRRFVVYWELAKKVGMQHGESFTFALNEASRARYLNDHLLGVRGAEALISIFPNRIKRAAYYVRNRVVLYDLGNGIKHIDVGEHFVPVTSKGHTLRSAEDVLKKIMQPSSNWERLTEFFAQYAGWLVPLRKIAENVDGLDESEVADTYSGDAGDDSAQIVQPGEDGTLYELVSENAATPAAARFYAASRSLESLNLSWKPISIAEAKRGGETISSLPMSIILDNVAAGARSVSILMPEEMELPTDTPFFEPGQYIIINPTQTNQEMLEIASTDPLTFTTSTLYAHETAEMIAVMPTRFLQDMNYNVEAMYGLIENSTQDIAGHFFNYGSGPFDWIYYVRATANIYKLEGADPSTGYFQWTLLDQSNFDAVELSADAKQLTFSGGSSNTAPYKDLSDKTLATQGHFLQIGRGAFDWLYLGVSTNNLYKLDGLDGSNDLLWTPMEQTRLGSIQTDSEGATVTFTSP